MNDTEYVLEVITLEQGLAKTAEEEGAGLTLPTGTSHYSYLQSCTH